jgi:hypothetical protein
MHISIVHDVKNIFQNLNHKIDSVNLSGATWVNKEKQGKTRVVDAKNWKSINQKMCDDFYKKYKRKLKNYDGFIHSYPPAFALLFEKFEKPIITIACTRFDFPIKIEDVDWLIQGLQRLKKNGQLISVANNLLDKHYCEKFLGFEWKYISSLCDYMQVRYRPEFKKFITWQRADIEPIQSELIDYNFSIRKKYLRTEISKYLGVVHIPYNLSIMSAFEHYYQSIPLFFPSQNFQEKMYLQSDRMLSEILFPNTILTFSPELIAFADWYNSENMPFINFFESYEHLNELLSSTNLLNVSESMSKFNVVRESKVYSQWDAILEKLK